MIGSILPFIIDITPPTTGIMLLRNESLGPLLFVNSSLITAFFSRAPTSEQTLNPQNLSHQHPLGMRALKYRRNRRLLSKELQQLEASSPACFPTFSSKNPLHNCSLAPLINKLTSLLVSPDKSLPRLLDTNMNSIGVPKFLRHVRMWYPAWH